MKLIAVLSIVLAVVHLKSVHGCSCMPMHPQIQFCQSDYVARFRVIGRETVYANSAFTSTQSPPSTEAAPEVVLDPRFNELLAAPQRGPPGLSGRMMPALDLSNPNRAIEIVYTVYIEKIYKGDEFINHKVNIKLTTAPSDGLCGVTNLEQNQKYILAGKVRNGELSISSCDFLKNIRDVTKRQRQGLKYHWKKQCGDDDCQVSPCFGQLNCPDYPIPNVCMLDISSIEYQCETDFARCTRETSGECVWYGKRDYKECQAERARAMSRAAPFFP